MICQILLFLLFAFSSVVWADKLNGVDLREAEVKVGCLQVQFQDSGFPDIAFMDREYFIRIRVENKTDQPCDFEPHRFRIVDAEGTEFRIKRVRIHNVEEGQTETFDAGDFQQYALVFGSVRLQDSKPALLYYKDELLGKLTK